MSDRKEFEKQLPPLPTLLRTRVVDGVPCISVSEHEYQMREYALQVIAQSAQAEVTDEQINAAYLAWCKTNGTPESFARAILALRPAAVPMTPLTDAQMENGRGQIFSINNPYCPCDSKTFKKVAQWVERHHKIGITAQCANTTKKEGV